MSTFMDTLTITTPMCQTCNEEVKSSQAYMVCRNSKHFYHKKCLKNSHKQDYDEKLDAGYIYGSGTNGYKKHQCSCGKKLKVHNKLSWKAKKALKYGWPLAVLVILL